MQLYPFQKCVFQQVMNGRNVILQAPTGSGKTRAALMPFLQNLARQGNELPLTCRYAVPMRVLANQFYREYSSSAKGIDSQAPTRLEEMYQRIGRDAVSVQTGEQPEDPQMEAALTFCTIDQLLASFLGIPYGLGFKRANLNVGGVLSSYLVLDEFHLYPLLSEGQSVFGARTTTLQMLRLLKTTTRFILMTATFSTSLLKRLETLLDAKVISVTDPQELAEIAKGRARTFWRSETPMDAGAILAEHRQRPTNKCTMVVCNTVNRAQRLYLQLRQAEAEGTRVVLLHSRFTTEDRRTLSQEIEEALGPDNWTNGTYHGKDIIVIATQVVEVGLDISVEVLHTENVPASSLIQRAGRCARFAQQQGHVRIYPLPLQDDGKETSTLPYNKELCQSTWQSLEQFHNQEMGFAQEQELIDAVHTQEDREFLDQYAMYEGEITKQIFTSFNTNKRAASSELIRNVAQVQILIHANPNEAIRESPWQWESFGLHPGSLMSSARWQALQQRASEQDLTWVCKEAIAVTEGQDPKETEDLDNREKTVYTWQPVLSPNTIPQTLMLAFPPKLARYDHELGFLLLDGQFDDLGLQANGYQSTKLLARIPDYEKYGSRQQSYQEHISGLVSAYNSHLVRDVRYAAACLEKAMGLETGTIDQAIRLAIACHDLGKLNRTWQQWALEWQQLVYQRSMPIAYQLPHAGYCFAKTDHTYSAEQREWQRQVKTKRPHHACESVMLGRTLIGMSLGITKTARQEYKPVLRAICGAIARHHTAQASKYNPATLSPQALEAATEALAIAHKGVTWSYDPTRLANAIATGGDLEPAETQEPKLTRPANQSIQVELETWLYFLIVRALRLSDQRAG